MKRNISLLLALVLLFSLCACNQSKKDANVISTKYYTITLPGNWENKCVCEIIPQENVTYTLELYEKTSCEQMGAGKLCSIMLFPAGDKSYKDFPDCKLLAVLDTAEGSYAAAALFPTDVQFSKDTAEDYSALFAEIMDVLFSIRPTDGVEMAMP